VFMRQLIRTFTLSAQIADAFQITVISKHATITRAHFVWKWTSSKIMAIAAAPQLLILGITGTVDVIEAGAKPSCIPAIRDTSKLLSMTVAF